MREGSGGRYVFPISEFTLTTPLTSPATPGLRVPLADLVAWGSGVEALTVYDTRVARRKYESNTVPDSPGPHRVVVAYKLAPQSLVESARKVRKAIEQWEASISDFRAQCERRVEEDESKIIVI